MIKIIVLFFGLYGALANSDELYANREFRTFGNEANDDSHVIEARIRGAENLNEKALPISRLFEIERDSLPGSHNVEEKSQLRKMLPGTKNLAEKSIPDYVIRRLSDPYDREYVGRPDSQR